MGAGPSKRVTVSGSGSNISVTEDLLQRLDTHGELQFGDDSSSSAGAHSSSNGGATRGATGEELRRLEDAWMELQERQQDIDELQQAAYAKGVTAGRHEQESVAHEQLRTLNTQWHIKMDEKNKVVEHQLSTEYDQLASSLQEGFRLVEGKMCCQVEQAAVTACYKSNPRRTLNCSGVVKQFLACATNAREEFLITKSRPQ